MQSMGGGVRAQSPSEGDLGWWESGLSVIRGLPVALGGTCQPGSWVRAGSACSTGGSHGQSEERVDLAVGQTCGSGCSQICLGQGRTWMRGNLPGRVTQDEQGDPPLPSAVRLRPLPHVQSFYFSAALLSLCDLSSPTRD